MPEKKPPNSAGTIRAAISMSDKLYKRLIDLAQQDHRSFSQYCMIVLEEHAKKKAKE